MRELDEKIFEAYQKSIQLDEAKGQEAIMGYIEVLDKPDAEIDLNNIASSKYGKGIKYKDLQNAAKALSKKGKIKFDGFNKINIIKESIDESSINERKFDLGSGHMGNGISVWNKAKEVHGDYEKIAHIDANRKIKYYLNKPPKDVVDYVEKIAKGKNPNISATQSQKVFREDINEASVVPYGEMEDRVKKFVDTLFKGTTYKADKQEYFDGIHGIIISMIDQFGGNQIRLQKKDLSKIMKNKDVRWIDISAIGM